MHRNDFGRFHDSGRFKDNENLSHQEMMLAAILGHRHHESSGRHRPAFGGMGGHPPPPFLGRPPPPFLGGHGMQPMMGGFPRHAMPPPMGMGSLGPGMGMGMGSGMGMSPHMPMGLDTGMDFGMGPGGPPLGHSPYARPRHSPFGYHSPGPPRAHSFLPPQHRHAHSPFSRPRRNPFPSSRMSLFDDDDDDFEDDYRMMLPPRRRLGRRLRGGHRIAPRYGPRRRGHGLNMFEDSEDEFDDFDEYADLEDEDELEMYGARRSPFSRWRGGF